MYTRVFSAILDSSIWQEDLPVRVLWLTMLIIADENRDGTVNVPIRRLAQKAALSEEQTRTAIDTLMAPDPDSDSPEEEGRRIVPLIPDRPSRGWRLVNWKKYQEIATAENRRAQVAENMRRYRAKRSDVITPLSPGDQRVIPSTTTTTSDTTSTTENLKSKSLLSSVEPPTPQTFKIGQPEYDLAALLLERIRHRNPEHRQPDLQKWARDIDLMHRLENRSFAVIREVIEWCQADTTPAPGQTFCWANNILSTGKLRKQFDQLMLKSGQIATGGNAAKAAEASAEEVVELPLRDRLLQHKPTVDVILETFGDPDRSRSALDAFCENAHFISGPPFERWAKWKALSEQEGI